MTDKAVLKSLQKAYLSGEPLILESVDFATTAHKLQERPKATPPAKHGRS